MFFKTDEIEDLLKLKESFFLLSKNSFIIKKQDKISAQLPLKEFKKYAFNFYRKGVDKLNIDYFEAFKDKIDTTNLKFQNIKISNNKIFINTTLGIFEVNSNCKILNFQPILTDEFEIVSDEIIYYRPYAFTSTIKNMYGSKPIVKIYDLTDRDTPRDVVGSLKMKTQLYVISRTSGLYKFTNEQFTSFKENNIWNENELQFIKKFKKNKIVISIKICLNY